MTCLFGPVMGGLIMALCQSSVIGGSFAIGIGIVIGMLVGAAIGVTLRASSKPQG